MRLEDSVDWEDREDWVDCGYAGVAELEDAQGLGPCGVTRGGSTPSARTTKGRRGHVKVDVRKEAPSRAVLEVELPPETVSQGMERALAQLNRRVEIRGFLRRKAPTTRRGRCVGTDARYEQAGKLLARQAA